MAAIKVIDIFFSIFCTFVTKAHKLEIQLNINEDHKTKIVNINAIKQN